MIKSALPFTCAARFAAHCVTYGRTERPVVRLHEISRRRLRSLWSRCATRCTRARRPTAASSTPSAGCALFSQRTSHAVGRDRAPGCATRCSTSSTAAAPRSIDGHEHELGPGRRSSSHAARRWRARRRGARRLGARARRRARRASRTRSSTWTRVETRHRDGRPAVPPRRDAGAAAAPRSTQFIGLVPPGRAPDHFHTYDEVIYVLDGEGTLFIGGEEAELRRRLVRAPARAPRALPGEHGRDASCACSASSDRPARRPRPITPTARPPSTRGDT